MRGRVESRVARPNPRRMEQKKLRKKQRKPHAKSDRIGKFDLATGQQLFQFSKPVGEHEYRNRQPQQEDHQIEGGRVDVGGEESFHGLKLRIVR